MKKNMKKLLCLVLATLLMVSVVGCGGQEANTSNETEAPVADVGTASSQPESSEAASSGDKTGSLCMAATGSDISDLSPFGAASGSRYMLIWELYDSLAVRQGLGDTLQDLQLDMAKSIEQIDDVTVRVELFDYIHDNQGNPIDADDVVWSYETCAQGGDYEKLRSWLGSITAIDQYTVEIVSTSPDLGALEYLVTMVPIVSQEWYESTSDAEHGANPAVTGVYQIQEIVTGGHLTVVKNENYWQTDESLRSYVKQQPVDTIIYNVISESAQRSIALENKEMDIASMVPIAEAQRFMNEDGTAKDGWTVYANISGRFNCMMFNCAPGTLFDNKELRQAVLYGIDTSGIMMGYGETEYSGKVCRDFGPSVAGDYLEKWNDEDYYDYNPEKASELLEASGVNPNGTKVRILVTNQTTNVGGATVLQSYLMQMGFDAEILAYDQALFNTYKFDPTQWDIILDTKSTSDYAVNAWAMCFDARGFNGSTANFVEDETLQELFLEAASTKTHSDETVDAFHQYLKEQAYGIGVYEAYTYFVAQDSIAEIRCDGSNSFCVTACIFGDGYQSVAQ